MEDFLKGRNNPLKGINPDELNRYLNLIAEYFGKDWLETPNGKHRIQELWQREDALSTNQLALLGDAISNMSNSNQKWVLDRIDETKLEAAKPKGDLFELLALSLFRNGDQKIKGASKNNPGYDGEIVFPDGSSCLISLKNLGFSTRYELFYQNSRNLESLFLALITELKLNGIGIKIEATRYPQEADWKKLEKGLKRVLENYYYGNQELSIGNTWKITTQPIILPSQKLDYNNVSHTITIFAPYHENEQKNVESNIEKACVNLSKHSFVCDKSVARLLLIRVSERISVKGCIECVERWLNERPDASIDAVFIYQPVVAESEDGLSSIVHFIGAIFGTRFHEWRKKTGRTNVFINAEVLVGSWTDKPTEIKSSDGNTISQQYIYQKGDIYVQSKMENDGSFSGISNNPAPGIRVNCVFYMPRHTGSFTIFGKFPPNTELALYY